MQQFGGLAVPAHFVMPNFAAMAHPNATACYQQLYTPWPTPEAPGGNWPQFPTYDEPTTICFRNIPNDYSGKMVVELLDSNGFTDTYNFIYVPHDFKRLPTLVNVGYFFVNFVTHDLALRAWEAFDGFHKWTLHSSKVLVASWATKTQGYRACVLRYQDSSVMHQDVPFECRPMFFESGKAVHQIPTKCSSNQSPFKIDNERQFIRGEVEAADRHIEGKVGGNRCCVPAHEPTTLCFRNIPNNYNGKMIQELLDGNGFKESYNFVYVPHDFQRLPMLVNVGYFFVNFTRHAVAVQAWDKLHGFKAWRLESNKVLRASWATKTQGLDACIHRYKDSPVLRQDVPFGCKPMRFENGQAVQFDHMQPPQIADACHHGQAIDESWDAHVHVKEVFGGSDSDDEADRASVSTASLDDIFSTSMCSTDTEDSAEMTSSEKCVPDQAATGQMTVLKDILPLGRPRWADIYDEEVPVR